MPVPLGDHQARVHAPTLARAAVVSRIARSMRTPGGDLRQRRAAARHRVGVEQGGGGPLPPPRARVHARAQARARRHVGAESRAGCSPASSARRAPRRRWSSSSTRWSSRSSSAGWSRCPARWSWSPRSTSAGCGRAWSRTRRSRSSSGRSSSAGSTASRPSSAATTCRPRSRRRTPIWPPATSSASSRRPRWSCSRTRRRASPRRRAAGLTVIGVPSLAGVELDEAHEVYASLADPGVRTRLGL